MLIYGHLLQNTVSSMIWKEIETHYLQNLNLTCFLDNLVAWDPCITISLAEISKRCSHPSIIALPSSLSINCCMWAIHGAESKYMKQRWTLWHDSFPLSSRARISLCLAKSLLTRARHCSNPFESLSFIHMQRNIAAAFNTSHMTPRENRVRPVKPENNKAKRTRNASVIQQTSTLL